MVRDSDNFPNINSRHEANSTTQTLPIPQENDTESVESREIAIHALEFNSGATTSFEPPEATSTILYTNEKEKANVVSSSPISVVLVNPLTSNKGTTAITMQPLRTFSNLPSAISMNIPLLNQPQSLFLQALAKVNESPPILSVYNRLKLIYPQLSINDSSYANARSDDLPAPDSLTSAPPSYSFVLRQMSARRRPRLMGTFIPSPSFVQHTPPPNYAAAFDIYVDTPMPPPPPRVVNFGFMAMPAVCPGCGFAGLTVVTTKITICTHLCALILCLFCCWICAPLPYMLRSCKEVYHYCRNCRAFLGMYCPTNPESAYP